jgi:hypothetical protein
MIEKLQRIINRLWSVDILALALAIMTLIAMKQSHHHTNERLNEMQDVINQGIHIPVQPSPPVKLEPHDSCE